MRCSLLGCLASAGPHDGPGLDHVGWHPPHRFGQFSTWLLVCALVVLGFIEHLATLLLKFVRALAPIELMEDGDGCASSLSFLTKYTRLSPLLGPLYRDGPLSSQPQPRRSDGEVAPRKDTREGLGLSFNYRPPRGVAGLLFRVVAKCATRTAVTSEVTGPNPAEG